MVRKYRGLERLCPQKIEDAPGVTPRATDRALGRMQDIADVGLDAGDKDPGVARVIDRFAGAEVEIALLDRGRDRQGKAAGEMHILRGFDAGLAIGAIGPDTTAHMLDRDLDGAKS